MEGENDSAGMVGEENNLAASSDNSITNELIQEIGKRGKPDEGKYTIPFYKLFTFANSTDHLLMFIGAVGAVANGAVMPIMTILFGNLIQSFGGASGMHDVVQRVSKVSLQFVYLAVGSGVASFRQVSCWMANGERQAARIRNFYLKTILR